ncbi:MAG: TadE/TadG family type IV pilus assembly protein [Propionibacteriaceae bacterium]
MKYRDERGMSESVQWAVLTPLLLLCLGGSIQTGIWLHATNACRQAAGAGADAAAISGLKSAHEAAVTVANTADLTNIEVTVVEHRDNWEVSVTGRARMFFDIGQGAVRASAISTKEK